MNNKTNTEFGFRKIYIYIYSELFRPQPKALADNTELGLNNS